MLVYPHWGYGQAGLAKLMRKDLRAGLLVGLASVLAATPLAGAGPEPGSSAKGAAFDSILMCERSPEAGHLDFKHKRHYAPADKGGMSINCAACHHDYDAARNPEPGACRRCHPQHGGPPGAAKSPL